MQPTVSQHLKRIEKNAGIIKGKLMEKSICYCINPDTLKKNGAFYFEIFRKIEKQKSFVKVL